MRGEGEKAGAVVDVDDAHDDPESSSTRRVKVKITVKFPECYRGRRSHTGNLTVNPKVKARFTVQNTVCESLSTVAYDDFDCEFGFDTP